MGLPQGRSLHDHRTGDRGRGRSDHDRPQVINCPYTPPVRETRVVNWWFLAIVVMLLMGWLAERRETAARARGDEQAVRRARQVATAVLLALLALATAATFLSD